MSHAGEKYEKAALSIINKNLRGDEKTFLKKS
jgi:hypothetical protein